MKIKYTAAKGKIYNDDQAQEIGEAIEDLQDKIGAEVKPSHLLDAARSKSHRLHSYFEWNNSVAAEKYRNEQAKDMIRSVVIIIETPIGPTETRAFVSVKSETEDGRRFVTVAQAMSNENYRNQAIEEALKKARFWRSQYKKYTELAPIFEAIDSYEFVEI